jgi:Mrp family chromosome partitioning ATPase
VLGLLRDECDVLIVDSPPVLPVTDPLILSGYVDGVIVVANANEAERKSMDRTRELLQQVNANVVGVSVNQIDSDAGYGYGYGYGYGGYAEDPVTGSADGRAADAGDEPEDERRSKLFSR